MAGKVRRHWHSWLGLDRTEGLQKAHWVFAGCGCLAYLIVFLALHRYYLERWHDLADFMAKVRAAEPLSGDDIRIVYIRKQEELLAKVKTVSVLLLCASLPHPIGNLINVRLSVSRRWRHFLSLLPVIGAVAGLGVPSRFTDLFIFIMMGTWLISVGYLLTMMARRTHLSWTEHAKEPTSPETDSVRSSSSREAFVIPALSSVSTSTADGKAAMSADVYAAVSGDAVAKRSVQTEPESSAARLSEQQMVFITYRREDSPYATEHLYECLRSEFGKSLVFRDVDNIPLGVDFREVIEKQLKGCSVVLVVIGNKWLDRLTASSDFVRIEVETALRRGIPVIPIYVDNATPLKEEELPESIKPLVYRNGLSLRPGRDFPNDIKLLCDALRNHLLSQ